jgi:hypothetical protein
MGRQKKTASKITTYQPKVTKNDEEERKVLFDRFKIYTEQMLSLI